MEESVVEEEDEGVFHEGVEASEDAEFLTALTNALRERSVTVGKTGEGPRFEECVETDRVADAEARDTDGNRRPGGET